MKCQSCNKRDAIVHLTEIKNGAKQEMHLCEHCAQEKGLPGKGHFTISELLAGITSSAQTAKVKKGREVHCPACGISLSQFQASGRFGCAECYATFRDDILPLVEKIHDHTQHTGKVPRHATREVSLQQEIRVQQNELQRAIKREDYEVAARVRDKIQ